MQASRSPSRGLSALENNFKLLLEMSHAIREKLDELLYYVVDLEMRFNLPKWDAEVGNGTYENIMQSTAENHLST